MRFTEVKSPDNLILTDAGPLRSLIVNKTSNAKSR